MQLYSASSLADSSDYLDHIYALWRNDPASVHSSWREYFHAVEHGLPTVEPTFRLSQENLAFSWTAIPSQGRSDSKAVTQSTVLAAASIDQSKVERLVRAYQEFGHQKAKINPLDLPNDKFSPREELQPEFYGLTEVDMDRDILLTAEVLPHFISADTKAMTLREVIKACEAVYCGSIGAEYLHVATREEREWIQGHLETPKPYLFPPDEKKRILDRLVWTQRLSNSSCQPSFPMPSASVLKAWKAKSQR